MSPDTLRDRITEQFSDRDDRADIWRAFDLLIDTDEFLNLGYSAWYQPHLLGSSQRRLAATVGSIVDTHLPRTTGVTLLDVGCGRGGPAVHLADRYGFCVIGVDLVTDNAVRARSNARGATASFVVGDAVSLPIRTHSVTACVAIDSIVYLPEKHTVISEVSRVLDPDGVVVLSDLIVRSGASGDERTAVDAFADAWDLSPLVTIEDYERVLTDWGFAVLSVTDITPNSVGRFRKWTSLYRRVTSGPTGRLIQRAVRSARLNPMVVDEQIRRAHEALPSLRHVIVVANPPGNRTW